MAAQQQLVVFDTALTNAFDVESIKLECKTCRTKHTVKPEALVTGFVCTKRVCCRIIQHFSNNPLWSVHVPDGSDEYTLVCKHCEYKKTISQDTLSGYVNKNKPYRQPCKPCNDRLPTIQSYLNKAWDNIKLSSANLNVSMICKRCNKPHVVGIATIYAYVRDEIPYSNKCETCRVELQEIKFDHVGKVGKCSLCSLVYHTTKCYCYCQIATKQREWVLYDFLQRELPATISVGQRITLLRQMSRELCVDGNTHRVDILVSYVSNNLNLSRHFLIEVDDPGHVAPSDDRFYTDKEFAKWLYTEYNKQEGATPCELIRIDDSFIKGPIRTGNGSGSPEMKELLQYIKTQARLVDPIIQVKYFYRNTESWNKVKLTFPAADDDTPAINNNDNNAIDDVSETENDDDNAIAGPEGTENQ